MATEVFALSSPLIVLPSNATVNGESGRFVTVEGLPPALGSLKRAEEGVGLILRLHEPHGQRGRATLRFARQPRRIERVNLLEEAEDGAPPALQTDGVTVELAVRPFEVASPRLSMTNA